MFWLWGKEPALWPKRLACPGCLKPTSTQNESGTNSCCACSYKVPYGTTIPSSARRPPTPDDPADTGLWGTVGAVALDADGNLAASTSTGGRITKRPGRVGDSPIIGASTYANNETVAVSTTGLGEKHMVLLTAKEISSLIQYRGMSVEAAAEDALKVQLVALGGGGGVIAMDKEGNIAAPYTDNGMYRGWVRQDGRIEVRIFDR